MALENMRPFQIGLLIAFAFIGILSVVLLASFKGFSSSSSNVYGDGVEIWGTFDQSKMQSIFQEISRTDKDFSVVSYKQIDKRNFEDELVNAIAEGRVPDGIIYKSEDLVTYRPKLLAVSYDTLSRRTIKNAYVDGAEIFALSDGLYAVPLAVDPIVMYWNRDLFAAGGLSLPPVTWESLTDVVQQLTLRDATRNLLQSTVAFGEYDNVVNAKATLLTLLLQSGSKMIEESDNKYTVSLNSSVAEGAGDPLSSSLQFYTEFSNVNSPLYSWNLSKETDLGEFLGGSLALYFGFGSEFSSLLERNPNLNLDITDVPQGAGATVKRVYGTFYGLGILKASQNPNGSYQAFLRLSSPEASAIITKELGFAPASRSLIASGVADPYQQVIYSQALVARSWLDPDDAATNDIFKSMVDDIVSNRQKVNSAASDGLRRLELAF